MQLLFSFITNAWMPLVRLICLVLASAAGVMNAQFSIQQDASVAKQASARKLLVVKQEPSAYQLKKSKREGTLNQLIADYEARNNKTFEYYKQYWRLTDEIIPVSESALDSIKKTKSADYLYAAYGLTYDSEKRYTMDPRLKEDSHLYKYWYYSFYIGVTEKRTQSLGSFTSRGRSLDELDFITAILVSQYSMAYIGSGGQRDSLQAAINHHTGLLKTKTLLIPDYLADIPQEEMEANYPYKIKIVSEKEILTALEARDSNYAFVNLMNVEGSCGEKFHHVIIDCGNTEPILLDKKSRLSLTDRHLNNYMEELLQEERTRRAQLIRAHNLKDYADLID